MARSGFDGLNRYDARARFALGLLDSAKLGKGVGRQVIRLVLRYEELRLHRVALRVVAYNSRAIRCSRACGFVEEGREHEAARVGDQWHDDVIMGVLAAEFDRLCADA